MKLCRLSAKDHNRRAALRIFANQTVCSTSLDSKYSILGSYLKASKGAGQEKLGGRGSGWMLNSLSHLSAPRPASRDSRGYSKEEEEDALMDSDTKDYPQVTTFRRAAPIAFF